MTDDSKIVKSKYQAGKAKYRWVVEVSNVVMLWSFNFNTDFIQETIVRDDWYESEGSAISNGNYYFNLRSSFAAINNKAHCRQNIRCCFTECALKITVFSTINETLR